MRGTKWLKELVSIARVIDSAMLNLLLDLTAIVTLERSRGVSLMMRDVASLFHSMREPRMLQFEEMIFNPLSLTMLHVDWLHQSVLSHSSLQVP